LKILSKQIIPSIYIVPKMHSTRNYCYYNNFNKIIFLYLNKKIIVSGNNNSIYDSFYDLMRTFHSDNRLTFIIKREIYENFNK
jgi:hypothetical protein